MANFSRRRLIGFALPIAAAIILVVLLIFALARLAQIQQDMRDNGNANMLWVLSQTQVTTLRAQNAVMAHLAGDIAAEDLETKFALFSSRLSLLLAGPQQRVLKELDATGNLVGQLTRLSGQPLLSMVGTPGSEAETASLLAALSQLDYSLSRAANKAMVAQWEDMGARLDRYRNSVLTIIFIMIGICLCSLLITASLFLALKRVRANEWLKRKSLQLSGELDAERKLGELHRSFNAMISHQLRTPLAIIDTSMQRLLRSPPPLDREFVHRHATKTRRAAARLARVVEHSLIAEQHAEGLKVRLRTCSLWQIVNMAIDNERSLSPSSTITCLPTTDTMAEVLCDPLLTEYVVANLLSNAIRYSSPDSPVRIRLDQDETRVFAEVADQGIGIHERDFPRLFQRYYRTHEATSIEGTGMGLFVVQSLLKLQSGTIEVRSTPGKGSVFRFSLPRAARITENQHAA